ncbi:RND transporter [Antarcticimicrobium sediminis]|uniref:RND transporter n=1 Tax=Antarcticimicrobium sediminis TaxID=2546227 RepID=A0A4R5F189_9RHOB|nr:RND transporter [Antarcticimicrobium sediminis]TDE40867.1 RND transporter [Antarcticimicrobium sediminis]
MGGLLDRVSWGLAFLLAVTLGLAPFLPEPHILQKLRMLADGSLVRPIDFFDLALHGAPWGLLLAKAGRAWRLRAAASDRR